MSVIIIVHLYTKDSPEMVEKVHKTLLEAAQVYRRDEGTVAWLPVQDTADQRAFSIFEKFDSENVC